MFVPHFLGWQSSFDVMVSVVGTASDCLPSILQPSESGNNFDCAGAAPAESTNMFFRLGRTIAPLLFTCQLLLHVLHTQASLGIWQLSRSFGFVFTAYFCVRVISTADSGQLDAAREGENEPNYSIVLEHRVNCLLRRILKHITSVPNLCFPHTNGCV